MEKDHRPQLCVKPLTTVLTAIDLIHKWRLLYFRFVIVQISLPSLTLEQEFFSIQHMAMRLGKPICTRTKE